MTKKIGLTATGGGTDGREWEHSPITVRVGYEWAKEVHPSKDLRWQFIRDTAHRVAKSLEGEAGKLRATRAFSARVSRMRALHGAMLLPSLLSRCAKANILIFDLTGQNPNVMLEIGIALALKGVDSGRVFVFQEVGAKGNSLQEAPSDLTGFFFTRYVADPKSPHGFRLIDAQGFRGAFRARLVEDARERGMWRDPKGVELEKESDDASGQG
jgi:hypothetical protein